MSHALIVPMTFFTPPPVVGWWILGGPNGLMLPTSRRPRPWHVWFNRNLLGVEYVEAR